MAEGQGHEFELGLGKGRDEIAQVHRARHRVERLHVVQAIGQFDQHDANIGDHRQDHFPDVLGLLALAALGDVELDPLALIEGLEALALDC